MTPYSSAEDNPIPSASDIQNALCAVDFISTCRPEELRAQIMYALSPPLLALLLTLHSQLELDPLVAALRSLKVIARERLQHESDDDDTNSDCRYLGSTTAI